MEPTGTISEGEWNSFGMCSEEADFMAQLLGSCSAPNEAPSGSQHWSIHELNMNIPCVDESSMYSFSQGSSSYNGETSILFPTSSHESYYPQSFANNNNLMTMDYYAMESKNQNSRVHIFANNVMEGDDFLNQDISNDSTESNENQHEDVLPGHNLQLRALEMPMPEALKEEKVSSPPEISKKRPRIPTGEVQRNKRSTKLKKSLKVDNNDEDSNCSKKVLHRQNSSSCCSEDESNVSHELNGLTSSSSGPLNSSGKTRASRGSATDPQSLYARKRRERINERLKILQNLVPNGTKVDISTMLEEAVQYVKFLQLQIKLLSSDDLWMYSPIAYNGMDLGLDLKIPMPVPKAQS